MLLAFINSEMSCTTFVSFLVMLVVKEHESFIYLSAFDLKGKSCSAS